MDKLISYAAWMVAAVSIFVWSGPAAAVPDTGMHVSSRIKIERPQIPVPEEAALSEPPEPRGIDWAETIESAALAVPAVPAAIPAVPAVPAVPVEPAEPAEAAEAAIDLEDPLATQLPGRFYSRLGRLDPFNPFLYKPEPEVTATEQEQLQIRAPQTPLERMDLAQLRLTSVLRMAGRSRALVEEATGKGYVISEGTYIGNKGGQVSKILPDRVIIEEKYLDIYGKVAARERELKLQN
jgi:Tfp pilus assembly protein PilP